MAFVKTCPTCGFGNIPTSPFCSQCGVSLVAIAPSECVEPAVDRPAERQREDKAVCPDCKAENESAADRCIYCDCALPPCDEQLKTCVVELTWPWGKEPLTQSLRIGRDPPAPEGLIKAISAHGYDNVSGCHAELRLDSASGGVTVVDLGSRNGTFVDGVKIPVNETVPLKSGAVVRFAANLSVGVKIHPRVSSEADDPSR
jgi:hypothetical protein